MHTKMSRLFKSAAIGAAFLSQIGAYRVQSGDDICAGVQDGGAARCPELSQRGFTVWYEVVNVGNLGFGANPTHLLMNGPTSIFGMYKPSSWDTAAAEDGSVWIPNYGSQWRGVCQCAAGLPLLSVASSGHDITVTMVRGPAPLNDPSYDPNSTCLDPSVPGCEQDEGEQVHITGGGTQVSVALTYNVVTVCDVIDWYENGHYTHTEVVSCWTEIR